jgi:hypothetical protein
MPLPPIYWGTVVLRDRGFSMDNHNAFDLAFRESYSRQTGQFAYKSNLVGTCGGVKSSATPERMRRDLPAWIDYAATFELSGVVAIVTPHHPNSNTMMGTRVAGTPVFTLRTSTPDQWSWVAVPGSEAAGGEQVTGSSHQVALRLGAAPSDPTIEQFNPANGDHLLYILTGELGGV